MNNNLSNCIYCICLAFLFAACSGGNANEKATIEAARVKMDAGAFNEAVSLLDEIIKANPIDTEALNMRGVAYVNQKSFGKALSDFNAAIEQDAAQYKFFYNRGNVKRKLQQPLAAIEDYTAALSLDDTQYQVWFNRALTYASGDFPEEAARDFEKALANGGDKDYLVHYYQANFYLRAGNFERGIAAAENCIKVNPKYSAGYYTLAQALIASDGSRDEACEHAVQAAKLGHELSVKMLNEYCGGAASYGIEEPEQHEEEEGEETHNH